MEASGRGRKMRINNNVLLTFPPRPLTDWEQETLRGWLEAVDGFAAFVSQRRRDDPEIYRRIVISRRRTKQHAYTIHAPQGVNAWIVVSVTEGEDIASFPRVALMLCLRGTPVSKPVAQLSDKVR